MNRTVLSLSSGVLAAVMATSPAGAQVTVDPELPSYRPVSGVSGSLKSVGSDSMNNGMTLWAEGFQRYYPNVRIEIEGKGSSTAPPALIAGSAQFGPMSRPMRDDEVASFEQRYRYQPTVLRTGIDMLAVYVNKDNPLPGLTLPQVDAIFSRTRNGGYPRDIRTWGQAGLTGAWANQPIRMYGRNAASGTYGFFREYGLFRGDYKDGVNEQPGSSAVVQGCASDRYGIGYSGIGYRTADVRAVPLAMEEGEEFVEVVPENAYTGEYPLARFLMDYVNHRPGSQLDPLRREFIRYIYSRQGQEDVIKDGYYPVSAAMAREALQGVGIEPGF